MSQVRALWVPFELADIEPARTFYVDHLGLSEVDSWSTSDERGSALQVAPGAFVEVVSPARHRPGPPPLAFEMRTVADVDSRFSVMKQASLTRAPGRYPRGHYGFEVAGPAGVDVMVWTEDRSTGER